MLWWVQDKSGHRRGPLSAMQISRLMSITALDLFSNVIEEGGDQWVCMASSISLSNALAQEMSLGDTSDTMIRSRLPLAEIPSSESVPCVDPACPVGSGCDVVYIWDRKWLMYLTYDEYVGVCTDEGLTDGLPDRALPTSADQVQELLHQADMSRLVIPKRELGRNQNNIESTGSEDEPLSDPEKEAKRQRKKAYRERKKLKRDAGLWVKSKTNPNIYVSGLPLDVGVDELENFFRKAGQIKNDPQTGHVKIRVYGHGDALITFLHQDSVSLSISLFNESEIRPGYVISVQQADFSEPGNSSSNLSSDQLRELAQLNKDKRVKLIQLQRKDKVLKSAWDASGGSTRRHPILVFTNCFDPRQGSPDYDYIESEVEKFCSPFPIKKVSCIRNAIDGYVCVRFKDFEDAEACIARMQPIREADSGEPIGFISNRKISAFIHDGRDLSSRLFVPDQGHQEPPPHDWASFLEDEVESDDDEIQIRTE